MTKIATITNIGFFKILKESFSLYFRNIFRLIAIVAWICLPASIFFVLIFYWGLSEKTLEILSTISYPTAFLLLLLLNMVMLKSIRSWDEKKTVEILNIYAQAFSLFFRYIWVLILVAVRIFLWSLPFIISVIIGVLNYREGKGSRWLWIWISFLFFIPVLNPVYNYTFSFFAFLIDGKRGMDALRYSKQLVKPNFWKLVGYFFLLSLIMQPVYKLIFWGIDRVQSLPLLAVNLFPLIFYNCLLNLFALTVGFFPLVFFYFLYKKFRREEKSVEERV